MRRPLARSGITWLVVLLVLVAFFVIRWLTAAGVFTSVTPVSPNICQPIARLQGPEDFEVDAAHDAVIVSSTNRRAPKDAPDPGDGLYVLKLSDPHAAPVKLADGVPKDFHPHGISLYRAANGDETLMAINHHRGGTHSVEIFGLAYENGVAKLLPHASIAGGLLVSPNDLFAVGPDRFYVTNDHATTTGLGRFAENYLIWPHADLVYFNGTSFRISVQRMAFPNGVYVSPDGGHLYVALTNERRIVAFSREPYFGSLKEIGSLSIPARLDNISADAEGRLIVAGHPSLLAVNSFRADPAKPSPSEVFRVTLDKDGVPTGYETIFADKGRLIGASSVAAMVGQRLLIGSVLDDKILECRPD
jgi:arylesterase/paraoxonase